MGLFVVVVVVVVDVVVGCCPRQQRFVRWEWRWASDGEQEDGDGPDAATPLFPGIRRSGADDGGWKVRGWRWRWIGWTVS
jgi:hypothetical protein